ncbi:DUF5706 domain-containing protein [Sphingomonas sp. BIUV-7]|uniref:DUF5706 domain-containing protein n=1 Tax=Sphingomonas natans TaxID=3063330 RepID=A0ABT8Y7U2_9SPHN|nr:Pycsar system effector family protein [Sphingomonas sp. BIUV-7]MDO6413968.1 DUF5706 domain-containing protein [Sphingomonas sp. BIUV-7]
MTEPFVPKPPATPANAIHMIRTTQQAHYTLSQMADQKASILMAATFVIFTITIGQSREGAGPPLALIVLGGFAFLSAILTMLAVLPATKARPNAHPNLLFFGSFTQLDQEEYVRRMLIALETDESIFRTMATDVYQNGTVLARKKYRLLGYAYRVFLVGLTASLLTFVAHYL